MTIVLWAILALAISFSFVVFFGAPYVPTLKKQRRQALNMLDLKKGQLLVELGAGDGIMLCEAGKRGWRAVGYELNPVLVIVAKLRTRKYPSVEVRWGNFWRADISSADAVYVFLIARFMGKLETKLIKEGKPGLKILSYTFVLPNLRPQKSQGGLHLYKLGSSGQKTSK